MQQRPVTNVDMCNFFRIGVFVTLGVSIPFLSSAQPLQQTQNVDQGLEWASTLRENFHHADQGSRLIPLSWLEALEQPDGKPFVEDHLSRYGFLANPDGSPLGVSHAPSPDGEVAGFTCAACHTREIDMQGHAWRIEGAPGFIDLQRFFADLDVAVLRVLTAENRFRAFAAKVMRPASREKLRQDVKLWSLRFHAYAGALPSVPWGPGRLDAFGLIYNQLAGLDVGRGSTEVIAGNIAQADAPARYPFLWNSPFQDKTDWPGFADNGNDRLALARNISEALGVFATFHPQPAPPDAPLNRDYLADNSEDLPALQHLEAAVTALKPPVWPWPLDVKLIAKGKAIFERPKENGGCAECHGAKPGIYRGSRPTLATPILNVGTDTRLWQKLRRPVRTGVMSGAIIPGSAPLRETDTAARLLVTSVVGILEQAAANERCGGAKSAAHVPDTVFTENGSKSPTTAMPIQPSVNAYEARVLSGIWAAAPYLHNGSVPTLADLLKTSARRPRRFAVGERYDPVGVGLAQTQAPGNFVFQATDCTALDAGNSNCGHEYGTHLPADEKAALIEYLKAL